MNLFHVSGWLRLSARPRQDSAENLWPSKHQYWVVGLIYKSYIFIANSVIISPSAQERSVALNFPVPPQLKLNPLSHLTDFFNLSAKDEFFFHINYFSGRLS